MRQMMPELKQLIGKPRVVIVGEPTSMQVAVGHKGKTALNVACHGQAGHSALAPQFVNAIHVAADFVLHIQRIQEKLATGPHDDAYGIPYSTIHIGGIRAGRALNTVPDSAESKIEFRHLADAPAQDILNQIDAAARQVNNTYPTVRPVTVETIKTYPGLDTDPSHALVDWADKMAGSNGVTKVPFGTEAGFFAELGLAAIVLGPGDMASDGHKSDEVLRKSELLGCDALMGGIQSTLAPVS